MFDSKKKWEVILSKEKVDDRMDWVDSHLPKEDIWFTFSWNLNIWAFQLYEHLHGGDKQWISKAVDNFVDIGILSSANKA